VLDTILDRAGRKGLLGRVVGNKILSDARQISLGDVLGDAAGDALTHLGKAPGEFSGLGQKRKRPD
jgi:hypothetical protein